MCFIVHLSCALSRIQGSVDDAGLREQRQRSVLRLPVVVPFISYLYLCSIVLPYLSNLKPFVANRSWFLISRTTRGSLGEEGCRVAPRLTYCFICEKLKAIFVISDLWIDASWFKFRFESTDMWFERVSYGPIGAIRLKNDVGLPGRSLIMPLLVTWAFCIHPFTFIYVNCSSVFCLRSSFELTTG